MFEVCHCCGELYIPADCLAMCTTCIEGHGGGDETINFRFVARTKPGETR
jgi:hypothetical protein